MMTLAFCLTGSACLWRVRQRSIQENHKATALRNAQVKEVHAIMYFFDVCRQTMVTVHDDTLLTCA